MKKLSYWKKLLYFNYLKQFKYFNNVINIFQEAFCNLSDKKRCKFSLPMTSRHKLITLLDYLNFLKLKYSILKNIVLLKFVSEIELTVSKVKKM